MKVTLPAAIEPHSPLNLRTAKPEKDENELVDEVVFGESRSPNARLRATTWSRIGGIAGAVPGLGIASTMFAASVANTGLENKARESKMPFLTGLVGVGAVAASALHLAGIASLFIPEASTLTSGLLMTAGCAATALSSATSFYIAGHHHQNWGQFG